MVKKKVKEESTDKSEIIPNELSEKPQRWCNYCGESVDVRGKKKNVCVKCGAFTAKYAPEERPEEEHPTLEARKVAQEKKGLMQKKDFQMSSRRAVDLNGKEMATAEILINAGLANDFNDLVRKGINVIYQGAHLPFGSQSNLEEEKMITKEQPREEPNPSRTLKQIQEGELFQAQIDKMKQHPGNQDNTAELIDKTLRQQLLQAQINSMGGKGSNSDPLTTMMMMRYLDADKKGKDVNENNFMDKIMQLQMMKSMGGGDNQQVITLQKEISDMKMLQQMNQMNQQKSAPTLQDQMIVLEKIRAERDTKINAAELAAQKERDTTLKFTMDSKLRDLKKSIEQANQSGGSLGAQRIRDLKEEITAIKEMSTALGDREKGSGEMIMEGLGNVMEKASPAITELIKQKRQNPLGPQELPTQEQIPQEFYEPTTQEQLNYESQNSSELTPSERQMSDTMGEIYLPKKQTPQE